MPIYEYQCDDCGKRVEAIQRLSDEPLTECGECGGSLRRLISAPAVQFKGTGWYVTDYAGRKGSDDGGAADKKAGASKSESKAESKPAAETPKKAASSGPSD